MVLAAPDRGELTTELVTVLAADVGRPVGDGKAPGDEQAAASYPYAIVYSIVSGPVDEATGSVTFPDREQLMSYQVSSIGLTREQADWMAHKCRRAITDGTVSPNGWRLEIGTTNTLVIDRRHNLSSGTNQEADVWRSNDRYQLMVTVRGPDAVFP